MTALHSCQCKCTLPVKRSFAPHHNKPCKRATGANLTHCALQVAVADRRLLTVQHVLLWPVLPLMLFMWQLASVTYLVRNPSRESRCALGT